MQRLVVGVDRSPGAHAALDWAAHVADLLGAELVRRGESDAGTDGDEGESGGAGRCEAYPAALDSTEKTGTVLLDTLSMARYLH